MSFSLRKMLKEIEGEKDRKLELILIVFLFCRFRWSSCVGFSGDGSSYGLYGFGLEEGWKYFIFGGV